MRVAIVCELFLSNCRGAHRQLSPRNNPRLPVHHCYPGDTRNGSMVLGTWPDNHVLSTSVPDEISSPWSPEHGTDGDPESLPTSDYYRWARRVPPTRITGQMLRDLKQLRISLYVLIISRLLMSNIFRSMAHTLPLNHNHFQATKGIRHSLILSLSETRSKPAYLWTD